MISRFLSLSVVLLFLGSRSSAQDIPCPDDFSTTSIGSGKAWSLIDRDNATGGSAQVAGGMLEISGKGEDIYNNKNHFMGIYRADIKGDFDISVKIISQENSNPWAQAGILIANNAEDLKQGGYFVLDISPGNALNAFYDAKDTVGWLESRVGSIGKTAYPVWLRVKKANKKFSGWYRNSENEEWKLVAENISPQLTQQDSYITLFSVSHDAGKSAKTVFDDFACAGSTTPIAPRTRKASQLPSASPVPAIDALGRDLGLDATPGAGEKPPAAGAAFRRTETR